MTAEPLDLTHRAGLPDALRVLLKAHPRETWESHGNFGEMVRFWLERHLMFRQVMDRLAEDAEALIDKRIAPDAYAPRLSRFGGFLLQQLHAHHQIEDAHYFPKLIRLDARLERGFEMLEADHHAIDGLLSRFADSANAVLQADGGAAAREATAGFHREHMAFHALLDRHLTDEEELVVPVILQTGFDG